MSQKFDRYTLHEVLGRGGMATVWRAEDNATGTTVAIKIMHAQLIEHPSAAKRFHREAQIASQLNHPHILKVLASGIHQGQPFLVLPYMPLGSLDQLFAPPGQAPRKRYVLSQQQSVKLLKQLASALDYAHKQGVIHRDLKLSNILRDDKGRFYLTDFGIARLINSTTLTGTGARMGTPAYMPPEQWRGEKKIDKRTDLYAFSVLAFLLLTGHYPFSNSSPEAQMHGHLMLAPPTASAINRKLNPQIDAIFAIGLAKDPRKRYGSALRMVHELENAIENPEARTVIQTQTDAPITGQPIHLAVATATSGFGKNKTKTARDPLAIWAPLLGLATFTAVALMAFIGLVVFLSASDAADEATINALAAENTRIAAEAAQQATRAANDQEALSGDFIATLTQLALAATSTPTPNAVATNTLPRSPAATQILIAQPEASLTASPTLQPCYITANEQGTDVYIGPGRAMRGSVPMDAMIPVTGYVYDEDGQLWWRIQPPDAILSDRYWVIAGRDITQHGDCIPQDNVVLVGTPQRIAPPTAIPTAVPTAIPTTVPQQLPPPTQVPLPTIESFPDAPTQPPPPPPTQPPPPQPTATPVPPGAPPALDDF